MNGVQTAIFSSSAMILLVLALRLFLKKHLPLKIAACTPFIPRIPPQALLAAQALLSIMTGHSE